MRFVSCAIAVCIVAATCGCNSSPARRNVEAGSVPAAAVSSAVRTSPDAATHSDPTPDGRRVIVCFGDSITAGYGIDREQSYPAVLQQSLDAHGYHYRVANLGVSGETSKDALARVPHVLAQHPAIVVVEFGGNDGLRGVPTSQTQRNLNDIVAALKHAGTDVVLAGISLPPQYGQDYVSRFNAMFPAVAHQQHVPLLPFIYKNVYGVPGDIQEDGVHPTAKGAIQVARNIEQALKPLLEKQ